MNAYQEFIASRRIAAKPSGFAFPEEWLNPNAFDYQRSIIKWMIRKGKACVFADCGLGKGLILLNGCEIVAKHTGGRVLILCPLAVGHQLVREADRFGIDGVKLCRSQEDVSTPISITNYERLHLFDASHFVGVACDESSIIKSIDGHIKTEILAKFSNTPYRFACTATPAPNDHMELGNHAEFVGAMKSSTMLATFFTHDGGDTSKWRLRGHAKRKFWEWVASWAVMCRTPADLGFDGSRFILPELRIVEHIIPTEAKAGRLFAVDAVTLNDQRAVRRETIPQRLEVVKRIIGEQPSPHIVWCNLNAESEAAASALDDAIEVTGSQDEDTKTENLRAFAVGEKRIIVSKASIAGFGLNWQHCANMTFFGLSHSWEEFYQAVRRCYRFGQTKPVTVNVVLSDQELTILENIKRKQADADAMATGMIEAMRGFSQSELGKARNGSEYNPQQSMELPQWLSV